MRIPFIYILLLQMAPLLSVGQYFEGTLKYNITLSGPDASWMIGEKTCTKMDIHIKDPDFIMHLHEGAFPTTRLFIADSNETYVLDVANNRAFENEKREDTSQIIPRAVYTGDSAMVLNELCRIYKVKKPKEILYYYVSDKYRVNLSKYKGLTEAKASFLVEGLEGRIPLKMIRKTEKLTVTTTISQILPAELDERDFRIPPGFVIKKRDNRR